MGGPRCTKRKSEKRRFCVAKTVTGKTPEMSLFGILPRALGIFWVAIPTLLNYAGCAPIGCGGKI